MELAVVCRHRARTVRVVTLAVAVLTAWVVAILLLPMILGLTSSVVDRREAAATGLREGTVLVGREVPTSDVRVGDRVRLDGNLRSVVAQWPGVLVTGPVEGGSTVRSFTADHPSVVRVDLAVPYAGVPFTGPLGLLHWLSAAALAVCLLLVVRPQEARVSTRSVRRRAAHGLTIG